ncbi:MAG: outer membrane lipoprotein chaperone LolA [Pseudomonadota bacterium]
MRTYTFSLLFGMILIILVSFSKPVAGIPLGEIVAKVQEVYQRIEDFKAEFIQESTLKSLNKTQVARGEVYFKNPGRIRWNYNDPTKQEIVTNGKTLWIYLPQDKQVTVSDLSGVYQSNISTLFLSGMGDLKRDFDIQLASSTLQAEARGYLLKLVPKELQPNVNELFLVVNKDTFQVVETYFYDFYGNLIRIKFKNLVTNRGVPDSLFVFTVPKDVEVIEAPHISGD